MKFLFLLKISNKPVKINKILMNQIIILKETMVISESEENNLTKNHSLQKVPSIMRMSPKISEVFFLIALPSN